jgi:hypothetical protein
LREAKGQHKINSIFVYYDRKFVYGLQVKYEVNGKEICTRGIGEKFKGDKHQVKKLTLSFDEWIKNISGYFGTICD